MVVPDRKPKVSVCVVTYNHEDYIAECLQSLVGQKTNFDFEIIVADDCSTDSTGEIVQAFANKHPDIIRTLMQPVNVGPTKNLLMTHALARGEYIGHVDGDDCALPGKLQMQADCLDRNPDVSFCAHAVRVMGSDKLLGAGRKCPEIGTMRDLLMLGTYFVASSVLFRRAHEFSHDEYMREDSRPLVDYFLHIERASKGSIFLDRRPFGLYRVHPGGISRHPAYRQIIEDAYELAFDRALELGVSKELVHAARLKRRMAFSIARYMAGDIGGYKRQIRIDRTDWVAASAKHMVLHCTRFFPGLVGIYARLRGMT